MFPDNEDQIQMTLSPKRGFPLGEPALIERLLCVNRLV